MISKTERASKWAIKMASFLESLFISFAGSCRRLKCIRCSVGVRTVPSNRLFKDNAPFILFVLMGPLARTLFSRGQFSVIQGKVYMHTEIAAIFAICDCDAHRGPEKSRDFRDKRKQSVLHCDLRVRWKVASDLRFRAAISEPRTPSFCGISGDLAHSTRKSLAIAIVRFWYAKGQSLHAKVLEHLVWSNTSGCQFWGTSCSNKHLVSTLWPSQCSAGVWRCLRSLPPDPNPNTG